MMGAVSKTAERFRQALSIVPAAYTIPLCDSAVEAHWNFENCPNYEMALSIQRARFLSKLEHKVHDGEKNIHKHYVEVSICSLAEQFCYWVESGAVDRHWQQADEELLWVHSRILAKNGAAASRSLVENQGCPESTLHKKLFELYVSVQYPGFAQQLNAGVKLKDLFAPMHHGWALRRALKDYMLVHEDIKIEATNQPIALLNEATALAMLKDLFRWYYGPEKQCLRTNLMPQRSWSRFCRKTDVIEGVDVAELYAAARYLLDKLNLNHGVDFSESQDVYLLRVALLQIAQWWMLSDTGRI